MGNLTFDELANMKPGLRYLREEAVERRKREHLTNWPATRAWYKDFKPRMEMIVGFMTTSTSAVLQSSEAYNVAYFTIAHALGVH